MLRRRRRSMWMRRSQRRSVRIEVMRLKRVVEEGVTGRRHHNVAGRSRLGRRRRRKGSG